MYLQLIRPIGWASGSMISNLEDLKIYASALVNGTMISKSSQDEGLKFINAGSDIMEYGLGVFSFGGYLGPQRRHCRI